MAFRCMVEYRKDVDSVLRELRDLAKVGGGLVENTERRRCKQRTQVVEAVAVAVAVEERDQQMMLTPVVRNS